MKLHHIAIWTFRLEELKEFYVRFFGGKSNEKYINPKKGFESYFISFGEGTDLELMSRTDVQNTPIEENRVGLTHFAFTLRIGRTSCVFRRVRDTAKSDKGASVKFWAARKGAGQARKGFSDARR